LGHDCGNFKNDPNDMNLSNDTQEKYEQNNKPTENIDSTNVKVNGNKSVKNPLNDPDKKMRLVRRKEPKTIK
jgi:hypothetical protein